MKSAGELKPGNIVTGGFGFYEIKNQNNFEFLQNNLRMACYEI